MKKFLIYVDPSNSNKYYNMELVGSTIKVEYGRVGVTTMTASYPSSKWNSLLNSKLKKGYEDVTDLKTSVDVIIKESDNKDFNSFFDTFKQYTGNFVKSAYSVEKCTAAQIKAAQEVINELSLTNDLHKFNNSLISLFKIIPRRMSNVSTYLLGNINDKNRIITREQDSLDAMDSLISINVNNPFEELNIDFKEIDTPAHIKALFDMGNNGRYKIYKCYEVVDKTNIDSYNKWLSEQKNQTVLPLIHGTRNPNVFGILKTGLLIRPSNAAVISGAAYGNGIYHSAHTTKSLGYTGYDSDKLFFIQDVHMGNMYEYSGWYRDGKGLDRNKMNYTDLKSMGYDSLFVKPGDGLLNSEYIVYNKEQSITKFLLHLK